MTDQSSASPQTIHIKRYSSRRLYNTATSDYVTLDDVADLIRSGHDIRVSDKKTGEDLTSQILLQIIAEQESGGGGILPVNVLTDLVRSYSDQAQTFVPDFLAQSFDMLKEQQQQLMNRFQAGVPDVLDPQKALDSVGEWQRQQMDAFGSMMMPWFAGKATTEEAASRPDTDANTPTDPRDAELEQLKAQMAAMQDKLSKL